MKIRRALLFVVALSLAFGLYTPPVLAQSGSEPTGFKNVSISVNPEYDDPRLLVMIEGQIVGVNPPVQVRFLVPTGAEMFSAGSINAQGKYSGGPPNRKPAQVSGWDEISYQLKAPTFRVEYYDPVISSQPDKKFAYDFLRLFPISDLEVKVQEPRNSGNFSISPQGTTGKDAEGFTVHVYNYTNLAVDNPKVHFDIAYTRTDTSPSVKSPQLNSGTTGANSGTGSPISTLTLIVLVVAVLVAGIVVWQLSPRRQPAQAAGYARGKGRSRAARRANQRVAEKRTPGAVFCTQCGGQVESTSRFCPYCGNKLNKP